MQHTLIPSIDRKKLHREYVIRTVTVSFYTLVISVVVGIAALFPAYLHGQFYYTLAQNAVDVAKSTINGESYEKIKNDLLIDSKLLAVLSKNYNEPRFSKITASLVNVRGPVSITAFNISKSDDQTLSIGIKGFAPTRNELIAFKQRLELLMPGTKIEIPIEQLAKNINPAYSLNFSKKIP